MLQGNLSVISNRRHGDVEVLNVGKDRGRWYADRGLVTLVARVDVVGTVFVEKWRRLRAYRAADAKEIEARDKSEAGVNFLAEFERKSDNVCRFVRVVMLCLV